MNFSMDLICQDLYSHFPCLTGLFFLGTTSIFNNIMLVFINILSFKVFLQSLIDMNKVWD